MSNDIMWNHEDMEELANLREENKNHKERLDEITFKHHRIVAKRKAWRVLAEEIRERYQEDSPDDGYFEICVYNREAKKLREMGEI